VVGTKYQTQTNLPELDEEGSIWLHPQEVLKVLVQWKDTTPSDVIWEPTTILQQFPHLNLCGQGCFFRGGEF
jgi:hypothetical protein